MTGPLISCIVPVHNSVRHLEETLTSILAQDYEPFEVVAVDDGSQDGSREILADYAGRVRYVYQENRGPSAARNRGVLEARGDFVAFLDADDLWHPEKLTQQSARFEENPALQICVCLVQRFWSEELSDEAKFYEGHWRARPIPGYAMTTILAKRGVFDVVGPLNETLHMADASDWYLRAAELGLPIDLVPEVLVYHRMHERNLTRLRREDSRDEFLRLVKSSLDRRRAETGTPQPYHLPG